MGFLFYYLSSNWTLRVVSSLKARLLTESSINYQVTIAITHFFFVKHTVSQEHKFWAQLDLTNLEKERTIFNIMSNKHNQHASIAPETKYNYTHGLEYRAHFNALRSMHWSGFHGKWLMLCSKFDGCDRHAMVTRTSMSSARDCRWHNQMCYACFMICFGFQI